MHDRQVNSVGLFGREASGGGGNHKLKVKSRELKVFEKIISLNNLFLAWREFKKGKGKKIDVRRFDFGLENNLFQLHYELKNNIYQTDPYTAFSVCDPKLRSIHKATVRDRVVHQAIYRVLYPLFDRCFIHDSYSCRLDKGTHRAVNRLEDFCRRESRNYTGTIYGLKCDIKKFFNNINHDILRGLLIKRIKDPDALYLIDKIIDSFEVSSKCGLPLGNVTSQLFANIYLNELDQFIKHELKIKNYLRYTDDFIVISRDYDYLLGLIVQIEKFLNDKLVLKLHPRKIEVRKFGQGIDFLGYVALPHYRVLRTKTKRRMLKKIAQKRQLLAVGAIDEKSFSQTMQSYFGILKHCRGEKIRQKIRALI